MLKYKLTGLFFAAFLLGFAAHPLWIKAYVEHRLEGITVHSATLGWGHVKLKEVRIQRPNLSGVLDEVRVSITPFKVSQVSILSGTLTVTIQDKAEVGTVVKSDLPPINAVGLRVSVNAPFAQVVLNDVHFTSYQNPHFESFTASVFDPGGKEHRIRGGNGSYEAGVVNAHKVSATETLPIKIPGVAPGEYQVSVDYARADLKGPKVDREIVAQGVSVGDLAHIDLIRVNSSTYSAELKGLVVNHPYLDPQTAFPDLSLIGFPTTGRLGLGTEYVTVIANANGAEGEGTCTDWASALPDPVSEAFEKAIPHFTGHLSWKVVKEPKVNIEIKNTCKFECSAEPIQTVIKALRSNGEFTYQAYDRNNQLFTRTVGPRRGNWVRFANLPPWVPKAFVTLEDPGFWKHRGVIPQALENSLKDNLALGKFHRGGSTITMQLVKNLWLTRDKTLNRKAQEFLMTSILESCLSKQEIFELYVNVVEFGVDLYGIGAASKRYFDSYTEHLTQEEAFYLASILPNPRRAMLPNHGGLARTRRLIQRLADNGRISDEDLEMGFTESLAPEPALVGDAWEAL